MSTLKFKNILIALEESPLADKVIAYTKAFHLDHDTSIVLLTVVPPISPDQLGFDPILGQTDVIVPDLGDLENEIAKQFLDKFTPEFPEVGNLKAITKTGNIKEEILNLADEIQADLIIMGTHGKSGFDHFISGSVSESVTRKATCPVLIVPNKAG